MQQQGRWSAQEEAEAENARRRMTMMALRAEMQQAREATTDISMDLQKVHDATQDLYRIQATGAASQMQVGYHHDSTVPPTEEDCEQLSVEEAQSMVPRPDRTAEYEGHVANNNRDSGKFARQASGPTEAWGFHAVAENGTTGEVLWRRPETTAVGWHWLNERQRNNMRLAQERIEAREVLAKRDAAAEEFLRSMPGPGHVPESHPDNVRDGLTHPAELYGIGRWRRREAASEHPGVQKMLTPSPCGLGTDTLVRDAAREAEIAAWERLYEQPRKTKQERASASRLAHERSLMEEEWASLNRRKLHLLRSALQESHARHGDIKESLALGKVWGSHLAGEVQTTKLRLASSRHRQSELKKTEEFRVQLARQQGGAAELHPARRGAPAGAGRDSGLRKAYIKSSAGAATLTQARSQQDCRQSRKRMEAGWRSFGMCGPPL